MAQSIVHDFVDDDIALRWDKIELVDDIEGHRGIGLSVPEKIDRLYLQVICACLEKVSNGPICFAFPCHDRFDAIDREPFRVDRRGASNNYGILICGKTVCAD